MSKMFVLKVKLAGPRPVVWRRIEVAADTPLPVLSEIILRTVGWHGGHLHSFETSSGSFASSQMMAPGDSAEENVKLCDIVSAPGDSFEYVYDFGDWWEHVVTVEKIVTASSLAPVCSAGASACPPEDCGGMQAYHYFLHLKGCSRLGEHYVR